MIAVTSGKSAQAARKEEQVSEFWAFDQSFQLDNDSTKTTQKQLPLLSNNFSDEGKTPTLSHCCAPAQKAIKLPRL